ncbi:hypothetical protein CUMW_147560 [Citrus unshiu]|nr:hypothetical protein CUMW_147560 [Citrus unshiu]
MASIATRVYESSEYEGRLFREISAPDSHYSYRNRQVEGSNVKQPKCFEAPYSFYRDYDLHSSSTQSDCKNIHPDVMRLDVKKRIKAD